ncbi:DUF1059 domain-containing protein [Trujillonella humicola]|uniref:DUF1059 domain-containing protein n=1 Tax=Trujillonella humicola TaxID=3383699 RepID=UPI0039066042
MQELRCRDAGFDCEAVVRADTVDDVLAQVGPHAEQVHGVRVTPELAGQLRSLVREVSPAGP